MKDTEKILRNWKIIWTILAIILTIFVVYLGVKINFPVGNDIGWDVIEIQCFENCIGSITKCFIEVDSASSIFFHLGTGFFSFLIIQILNVPIWILRGYLIKSK